MRAWPNPDNLLGDPSPPSLKSSPSDKFVCHLPAREGLLARICPLEAPATVKCGFSQARPEVCLASWFCAGSSPHLFSLLRVRVLVGRAGRVARRSWPVVTKGPEPAQGPLRRPGEPSRGGCWLLPTVETVGTPRLETARGTSCHSRRRPMSSSVPHLKRTGPRHYGQGGALRNWGAGRLEPR